MCCDDLSLYKHINDSLCKNCSKLLHVCVKARLHRKLNALVGKKKRGCVTYHERLRKINSWEGIFSKRISHKSTFQLFTICCTVMCLQMAAKMGGDQMPNMNNSSPVLDPSLYGFGGQKRSLDNGGKSPVDTHT